MEDSHNGSVHRGDHNCYNTNVAEIINEVEQASANHVVNISDEVEDLCGEIVISIQGMLDQLPCYGGDKCNIYRVPKQLRMMNDTAYGPQFISIGPFHHRSRNDLIATERYKVQGLNNYRRRIEKKKSLVELVREAQTWVEDARICYAEPINMNDLDFVRMMLVDGCFIVEYLILDYDRNNRQFSQIQNIVNRSFYEGISSDIHRDLTKLENQVPFFVLQRLFDLIPQSVSPTISFIQLTLEFFNIGWIENYEPLVLPRKTKHFVHLLSFYCMPWPEMQEQHDEENKKDYFLRFFCFLLPAHWQKQQQHGENNEKKKHWFLRYICCCHRQTHEENSENKNQCFLFSLFSSCLSFFRFLCSCHKQKHEENSENKNQCFLFSLFSSCLSFFCFLCCCHRQKEDNENKLFDKQLVPPSITELSEAGVTIKKIETAKCITNISFTNGVLKIPPIIIDDNFETILRNLIAFEQFPPGIYQQYAIQDVRFLDELISTEKDVSVLVKAEIIINNIGSSDKEVSRLFNNLCKFVTFSPDSYFDDITKALRQHCSRRCNKWIASLKHNYFNTPWAFISFLAATFLIVLTLLQTIFAVVSISN